MTAPPDDELSLLYDVYVLSQQVRTLLTGAMQGAPLTPEEYALCSAVRALGPVSTSDLARALGMPVTTAHDHVRALLARGDLTRQRDPRDGRVWLLSLSRDGRRHHLAANRRFEPAMDRLRGALPMPESEARDVVRRLAAAVAAASDALAREAVDPAS